MKAKKSIPFVKASACGNDFLVMDAQHAPENIGEFTRRICDRNNGVGADGVEWISTTDGADIRARLVNADGSDAEISGNGTRCVAAFLAAETGKERIRVATDAGVKLCELTRREDPVFEFKTDMGAPVVGEERVLQLKGSDVRGVTVSMGNPHFVIFVNEFLPGWQTLASEIQAHPSFPESTNVELVKVRGKHEIEISIYERGVGETHSSGTGSSAAAVASIATGRVQSPVEVHAPGGTQTVEWEHSVLLFGPARIVCRGEFFV